MLQGFSLYGEPDPSGDYDERARKRRLAEALMVQGADTSPVRSWTQGAARLAQALIGGYESGKYDREQKAADDPIRKAIAEYTKTLGGSSAPAMPTAPAGGSPAASGGPMASPRSFTGSQGDFISALKPHAEKIAAETGLDPRLIIAQSALETGWGKSAPGNNYFGIKSHGQPGGNTLATTEVVNGQPVQTRDSFRSYGDMGQSAADYAAFLKANPRYREVLGAQGLDAQIEAMARSGYATDPMYGNKLRQIASGIQLPQGAPQAPVQVASLDGLPPGPVPSGAPPQSMAYAPGAQAINNAAPQAPRGQGLVNSLQQPPQIPPPQPTGNVGAALLAAAMSPGASPQLRQQALQLYQLGQRDEGVSPVDLGDRIALMNKRGQVTGFLPKSQAPRGPVAVGPDQRLIDPNTGREIAAAQGNRAPTVQKVKLPDGSEVAVQWDKQRNEWVPLNAPQGGNAVAPTLPKLTEQQSKDVGFVQRGKAANEALTADAEKALLSVPDTALQNLPEVLGMNIGRRFQDEKFQTAFNAGRNFLAVVLRKDTGAAITKEEWKEYTPLFIPQPGDTPDLLAQKRENRKVAMQAMEDGLGNVGDVLARVMAARKQAAPTAPATPAPKADPAGALAAARDAIAKGAPREAVIKRLQENGIDATGL